MKLNISLSGYTTHAGLYSSVKLDSDSKERLIKLCKAVGFRLTGEPHCTIMYSKDIAIPTEVANRFSSDEYRAKAVKFTWWLGHDKRGYIALKLASPSLMKEFRRLSEAGCDHSFPTYVPHITITTPYKFSSTERQRSALLYANLYLAKHPLDLEFGDQTIEDLTD